MRMDQPRRLPLVVALIAAVLALPAPSLHAQSPRPEAVGQRPDAPIYAKHGPYWVGVREAIIQADGGRALPTTIWYPAVNPKGAKETGTIKETGVPSPITINSRGILDGPPDSSARPYPLVVYMHGKSDEPQYHAYHLAHLASHGFIVIGADFETPQAYHPSVAVQTINFAVKLNAAGPPFAGLIDVARVAVEGYSMGGPRALETGGACSTGSSPSSLQDSRVKAVIAIAPYISPDQWNFSAVKLPALLMICSNDENVSLDTCNKVYKALPTSRKSMAVLLGGTHLSFVSPDHSGAKFGTLDKGRTVDLFNHFVTAFLMDTLKSDTKAHKALLPEGVKFAEIKYTATLK